MARSSNVFYLRCTVCVIAVWLTFATFATAVSVQTTYPLFTATGGHNTGGCTTVAPGGTDSPTPVVFRETCPPDRGAGSGAAGAMQGAVVVSASATGIGNSVL